jgi:oxaloacetate decarboxylase alpha subunit
MAGLLKPYEAYELVKAIKQVVDIPLDIHSHATTGMSVATLVKSAEAGAELIDTTISSLSMGTSHSPTETMVEIFAGTPFETDLDIKRLMRIAAFFRDVRRKYKSYESAFLGADTRILVSQVPGGMLSNLESQLREQNALDKIDAVLEENAIVQKDFGYPPLVTPTSQIVGTQSVLNVMFGRYKQLSKESMLLLAGSYGRTPAKPNPDLVKKALEGLKMTAAVESRPADTIPNEFSKLEEELKSKTGASSVTAEDVMTYAMFPQVALSFFKTRANGPATIEAPVESGKKPASGSGRYVIVVDGKEHRVTRTKTADGISLVVDGKTHNVAVKADDSKAGAAPAAPASSGKATTVPAPMPGVIVRRLHEDGTSVAVDQSIIVMEALKMQMEIRSTHAGSLKYRVNAGDQVKAGDVLADIV